jgi:hypothetical protein
MPSLQFWSGGRLRVTDVAWLGGAAPAFDEAVTVWLASRGHAIRIVRPLDPPPWVVPALTRWKRVREYRRLLSGQVRCLILPYVAGDAVLLAGAVSPPTLGVLVGSDVLRRRRTGRHERAFRRALRRLTGVWAVSDQLAQEVDLCSRPADWVAPVGVDLASLPRAEAAGRQPGLVLSARTEAPVYRRTLVREAIPLIQGASLVEAERWAQRRLFDEMTRSEVVVSLARTDGAPATLMEALCLGAHVVASGGPTVRAWIEALGGTYGEPTNAEDASRLIRAGLYASRAETEGVRRLRATQARAAFDRNRVLQPLERWLDRFSG